ncbi:hypothetical protein CLS_03220 [[Clostridium] cf. saccharolyticum K10]|nr:hypothetical protein CLS_03220 [[Clostridium] cf. saccharolyticum K10]
MTALRDRAEGSFLKNRKTRRNRII